MTAIAFSISRFGAVVPSQSVTGIVIAADGPNAASVERFSLRSSTGQVIPFVVGRLDLSDGGLPAPHLREHLVSGIAITVFYDVEDRGNVALRYIDAQP